KDLQSYLTRITEVLQTHGRFLTESNAVDTTTPDYQQLVTKIDEVFEQKSTTLLPETESRLVKILFSYLKDLISKQEAAEQIKLLFGEEMLHRDLKKKLKQVITDLELTVNQLDIKLDSQSFQKLVQLMQQMFNWFESSLEFIHKGW
ncbi:MAG: hypothetical protein ACFFBD_07145, partial [Candidatus Hodarchaeota archaeon]